MIRAMLTTTDNPFDPFDQFNAWYAWDMGAGYNTAAYLARVAFVSREVGEVAYQRAIEDAIDEIVDANGSGIYKKVTKDFPDELLIN